MRVLLFILQKEFLQIFRNRALLPIIFVLPIIQLIVLANAATFELKEVSVSVIDQSRTETSRSLVQKLVATGYFVVTHESTRAEDGTNKLMDNSARMVLQIPADLERDIQQTGSASVQMIFDAQDGATAGVAQSYANSVVADFNGELDAVVIAASKTGSQMITVSPANWFNPKQKYTTFMVPGILVVLVTIIGMFISAMNIVREKEIGTIEQLNVTPITKSQFVVGKLLPLWILGLFELGIGLIVAKVIFDIPIAGSISLVFAMAGVYLLVTLGFGLLLSTVTHTQQQSMFLAWFFMVIFILMSGLFTPIESMPTWAQNLTMFNPVAHFIRIMRRVLLMGADFRAIRTEFLWLSCYAAVVLTLAIRQYRKTTA